MSTYTGNIHFGKEKRVRTCTIAGKVDMDKIAAIVKEISTIKGKLVHHERCTKGKALSVKGSRM